ncbi:MAG: hypothetical protein ING12_03355 [Roseomonas sp.]|nr:hypothetical protein [Roseomonas sp.]
MKRTSSRLLEFIARFPYPLFTFAAFGRGCNAVADSFFSAVDPESENVLTIRCRSFQAL